MAAVGNKMGKKIIKAATGEPYKNDEGEDLLRYIPMQAIKLFNQYNRPCPMCKTKRMEPKHMEVHDVELPVPLELIRKIDEGVKNVRMQMKKKGLRFERVKAMNLYALKCKVYMTLLDKFAASSKTNSCI